VSHFISKFNRSGGQESGQKFTNLYVKNFDDSVDERKLKALFAQNGEVTSLKIMRNKDNISACFGFVNFAKPEDAALVSIVPPPPLSHFIWSFLIFSLQKNK
jgi:polyadenylate-binding protein